MLEDVKILLNVDDSKDPILNIFKKRSIMLVKSYLNNSTYDSAYIEANFEEAIIELIYNAYSVKGKENIQSESQGSRSVTYKGFTTFADGSTFAITQNIKVLLPLPILPSIKIMG
ncbi:phage head-tail connector protein [Clostridium estertheticum]|nr:phage head-tail connector protein [Clostridium estertheticum]